jgi:hypothetical protein
MTVEWNAGSQVLISRLAAADTPGVAHEWKAALEEVVRGIRDGEKVSSRIVAAGIFW